jgi:hypothetical protein
VTPAEARQLARWRHDELLVAEVARVVDHDASKVVLEEEDYRHQQAAELRLDWSTSPTGRRCPRSSSGVIHDADGRSGPAKAGTLTRSSATVSSRPPMAGSPSSRTRTVASSPWT